MQGVGDGAPRAACGTTEVAPAAQQRAATATVSAAAGPPAACYCVISQHGGSAPGPVPSHILGKSPYIVLVPIAFEGIEIISVRDSIGKEKSGVTRLAR